MGPLDSGAVDLQNVSLYFVTPPPLLVGVA